MIVTRLKIPYRDASFILHYKYLQQVSGCLVWKLVWTGYSKLLTRYNFGRTWAVCKKLQQFCHHVRAARREDLVLQYTFGEATPPSFSHPILNVFVLENDLLGSQFSLKGANGESFKSCIHWKRWKYLVYWSHSNAYGSSYWLARFGCDTPSGH